MVECGTVGRIAIAAALAAIAALAPPAGANTYRPNKLGDHAADGCTRADCTLREALNRANAHPGPDTIVLRPGKTYVIGLPASDFEDGNADGDFDSTGPLTLRSRGRRPATIDGALNSSHIVHAFASIRLTRLRILHAVGQGIRQEGGGSVTLVRSTVGDSFLENVYEDGPGGVRLRRSRLAGATGGVNEEDGGSIVATDSTVAKTTGGFGFNETGDGDVVAARLRMKELGGRGIQETDAGGIRLEATGISSAESGRGVQEFGPGGIGGARVRVTGSDDEGIVEHEGGSIVLRRSSVRGSGERGVEENDEGDLILKRARVIGNDGGGVLASSPGTARIKRSTIADNLGTGVGLLGPEGARMTASTISGNEVAGTGGGIALSEGSLSVVNSTVAGNGADIYGGGVAVVDGAALRLNAVTVARNVADLDGSGGEYGGGLYLTHTSTARVDNSLIALNEINFAGLFTGPDCYGLGGNAFDSGGHNLLTNDLGCEGFGASGDRVRPNPKIGQLVRNGGPTKTIALRKGSPAINAAGADSPGRDQRGMKRKNPDIGAFERRARGH